MSQKTQKHRILSNFTKGIRFSLPLSGETELSRKALKPQGTMTADPRSVSSLTASKALFASSSENVATWG
jgi:hypothetical protein